MYTRKQYLNHECTHAEYFAQFTDDGVRARVLAHIGLDELKASTDEHMNDIALNRWDAVLQVFPRHISEAMREAGDYPTQAGAVCIAKQAAREILAANQE